MRFYFSPVSEKQQPRPASNSRPWAQQKHLSHLATAPCVYDEYTRRNDHEVLRNSKNFTIELADAYTYKHILLQMKGYKPKGSLSRLFLCPEVC